jgi:hypothetical protein
VASPLILLADTSTSVTSDSCGWWVVMTHTGRELVCVYTRPGTACTHATATPPPDTLAWGPRATEGPAKLRPWPTHHEALAVVGVALGQSQHGRQRHAGRLGQALLLRVGLNCTCVCVRVCVVGGSMEGRQRRRVERSSAKPRRGESGRGQSAVSVYCVYV